ncbi:tetraspanin 36 [Eucyclogobius newberryi]|uniref:tetraspanin 36 n=1 Tax=Eucyclogobius newberryi TaxID=166745 RepID=UPI003B5C176E
MDCGIITSKTVLLFLSLIFWAAGAFMGYVGYTMVKTVDNFESFIQDHNALIPAAVVIGISVFMFIFGIVGCCSTFRESKFGLSCFFVIIMVIFAAEVAALVCTFIFRGRINPAMDKTMTDVFAKYNGENSDSKAVDYLQSQLQCCGVKNYTSWRNTTWFATNGSVPVSCCKRNSTCTGSMNQPDLLYVEGCEVKLVNFLHQSLSYAMLVILGFAIVKFFGMLSVCVITCKSNSKRNGYESFYA